MGVEGRAGQGVTGQAAAVRNGNVPLSIWTPNACTSSSGALLRRSEIRAR
jgi:hypothetical protein